MQGNRWGQKRAGAAHRRSKGLQTEARVWQPSSAGPQPNCRSLQGPAQLPQDCSVVVAARQHLLARRVQIQGVLILQPERGMSV